MNLGIGCRSLLSLSIRRFGQRTIFIAPRCYSSSVMSSSSAPIIRRFDDIKKSPQDKRLYRGLELRNGLRTLLVSDPELEKAAAALDVNAGYLMDPPELPGLAHFCEHMLFLGTDKYPSENEYSKFITSHGGSSNAFTSCDHTNYQFDIAAEHLNGALDRFVQFFISPQFTESATEREVMAVDSENTNNLNNDGWRLLQLERSLSDPSHDYHKFGTGSKKTLMDDAKEKGIDTRTALLNFHSRYYSADIMSCCVIGTEGLDQLEKMVIDMQIADIVNNNVGRNTWKEHPYGPDQVQHKIEVVPVKDIRNLSVYFPIPDLKPFYRSQPGHYVSHLLGHEGKGSLLSELKRRGWVSSLTAGGRRIARGFGFFAIEVDLSEEGLKHVEEIVQLIFNGIGLIKRPGPLQWVHDELKQLNEQKFRFKDKEKTLQYAVNLSSDLQNLPFEDILCGDYRMDEYRPDLIEMLINKLNPNNMCYAVVAKQFADREGNTREPWYGTEYQKQRLDQQLLENCQKALIEPSPLFLTLPEPNEYIPKRFDLRPRETIDDGTVPQLNRDNAWIRAWFLQDNRFLMPKCCTYLLLSSPLLSFDPLRTCLSTLFVYCLQDALAEETYNPYLAGLSHSIEITGGAIALKVWGFDEKQPLFVKSLVKRMATFQPDEARFFVLKENFVRHLRNFQREQPYAQAVFYTSLMLSERTWSKQQLLNVIKDVTVESLTRFIPELLSALHVEALIYGNTTRFEADQLADSVVEQLKAVRPMRPLFARELMLDREHQLQSDCEFVFTQQQQTHANSAIEMYLQTGMQETRSNMLLELVAQLSSEPAFNQLRTLEQLGYIVFSGTRRSNGTQGLHIIVQGQHHPEHVEARVENFICLLRQMIADMPDEEFKANIEALATKRLEKPKKLSAQAGRYWGEIVTRFYHFKREPVEVEDLRKINREDLLNFFDRCLIADAPERRKLIVHIHSNGTYPSMEIDGEGDRSKRNIHQKRQTVENIVKFKARLPLYPLPDPEMDLPPVGSNLDEEAQSQASKL